ncbi:hypothetical protein, partial [Aeribacillus pallidus]|uniref:hypothetical protein n=1 Tax=Aeribacillus pallidus TaxID=33936 RepID=UPI001A930DEA
TVSAKPKKVIMAPPPCKAHCISLNKDFAILCTFNLQKTQMGQRSLPTISSAASPPNNSFH